MAESLGGAAPGLRERKKLRTRSTLIDAAVQLCLAQGYEQTTVEQIAVAADVSPRTFSRYFATKGAVMMTLLEDLVDVIAVELARIPHTVPVLQALHRAHVSALRAVAAGDVPGLTNERIVLMLRIINSTNALKSGATDFRPGATLGALAERMGTEVEDRKVTLVTSIWSAIIVTACGDLVADGDGVVLGPELMIERLNGMYAEFIGLTRHLAG